MKRQTRQKGFLAIVAVVIVTIIAFIAVTATYQFTGDSSASFNHLRSAQAFYIAQAGIEQAKSDIVTNGTSCSGYTTGTVTFTPPSGSGAGQYQVTGTVSSATSTLNGNIGAGNTTIPVASTSNFSSPGAFQVDTEIISYTGISGNNLTGAVRGVNGTTAAAHSSGAMTQQNECFLTSTAGIPSIGSPNGERIIKALITGTSFGFTIGGNFVIPSMTGSGNFNLQGNPTISNPSVSINGPGYPGSNILTSSSLVTTGNSWQTTVTGGTVSSSGGAGVQPDIQQNTTLFNSSTLFSQYFNTTPTQFRTNSINNGTFYASGSNILGLTGQIIWYDGDLTMTANSNIGSLTSPVLLIVNGNLTLKGSSNIEGFVYVIGTTNIGASSSDDPNIAGAIVSQNDIFMKGNAQVTLDQNVLNSINQMTGNQNVKYSKNAIYLQENFP